MIQKPMLRVEVCARALRASQNVKKEMRALCVRSAYIPLFVMFDPAVLLALNVDRYPSYFVRIIFRI